MPSATSIKYTLIAFFATAFVLFVFYSGPALLPIGLTAATMSTANEITATTLILGPPAADDDDPPTVTAKITNASPETLTFLRWNTPLDPAAPVVGVFIVDGEKVDGLKINHKMPPAESELVTLKPGESVEVEHKLLKKPEKKVRAEWAWGQVWEGVEKGKVVVNGEVRKGAKRVEGLIAEVEV